MKTPLLWLILIGLALPGFAAEPKRVLLVTTTTGFRHSSIELGEKVIRDLAARSGDFVVTSTSEHPDYPRYAGAGQPGADAAEVNAKVTKVLAATLNAEALKSYDAILFLHSVGELPFPDRAAFFRWIEDGGAVVGVHAASDSMHATPEYARMLGGAFDYHGRQAMGEVLAVDPEHPAAEGWGAARSMHEEFYIFKHYDRDRVHLIFELNRRPADGRGEAGTAGHFPMAWTRLQGKGRVFYTALGHREDIWDPVATVPGSTERLNSPEIAQAFQRHLLGGIRWALGLAPGEPAAARD